MLLSSYGFEGVLFDFNAVLERLLRRNPNLSEQYARDQMLRTPLWGVAS
jgi:hypothetical protein